MRALRHRDFLILWLGALLSFTGSWVQNVGQQTLVFSLTHDEAKLGLVAFCGSAPVALLGPLAGTLVDLYDKRRLLIITQIIFAMGAFVIAASIHFGFVAYWMILCVATVAGITSCIEMPSRQSIVSTVVPLEDLPSAIPLQAMTFNLARVVGPAIGGILLTAMGPFLCYIVNGCSYAGLIGAAASLKTNLKPKSDRPTASIAELIKEGVRFTFRDKRLRTLFIMEAAVSTFGLFYISIMVAIAEKVLKVDKAGFSAAMSFIGIGALCGLLFVAHKGNSNTRGWIVRIAMASFGIALVTLGFTTVQWVAYLLLAVLGMASIMQFNTTNAMFQMIAPEHLRGRVIAMHVWALSGLGPFGTLFFSWLAREASIPTALKIGGTCVLIATVWGWRQKEAFEDLP